MKQFFSNLVVRIIIGIIAGVLIGHFLPQYCTEILVTFAGIFSEYLKFIIPLMVVSYIVVGIGGIKHGAGKLLGLTVSSAYLSTIIAGLVGFIIYYNVFPKIIPDGYADTSQKIEVSFIQPYFSFEIPQLFNVVSAVVLAFIIGLSISILKNGETIFKFFEDFEQIIKFTIDKTLLPIIPFYIAGTFAKLAHSGQVLNILSVFGRVFIVIVVIHIIYLAFMFITSGTYAHKNPVKMMQNQVPAYLTAAGTQSSAATIPVSVKVAEKNGVVDSVRNFVMPLCATIHLAGAIITIPALVFTTLILNGLPYSPQVFLPFLLVLTVIMVAAPGIPGGGVMCALPFFYMVGIDPGSTSAALIIALYIVLDSLDTAANVSGDSALCIIIDKIYKKHITNEKTEEA